MVDPALKFKGVLVHPDEIAEVMKQASGDGLLELKEAARLLDWPHGFSTTIVNMKTPDGVDYIQKQSIQNAKGRVNVSSASMTCVRFAHLMPPSPNSQSRGQ